MKRQRLLTALVAACAFEASCHSSPPAARERTAATVATPKGEEKPRETIVIDATRRAGDCSTGHHGPLIDFGEPNVGIPRDHAGEKDFENVEHDGATWARVHGRTLAATFLSGLEPQGGIDLPTADEIQVRLNPGAAHSVTIVLNGKVVGVAQLRKGPPRVVNVRADHLPLVTGINELSLQFHGPHKAAEGPQPDVDWVHIGGGEGGDGMVAPTWASAILRPSLGGVTREALALPDGSYLRCVGFIPSRGTVRTSFGIAGTGSADVSVRLLRDHGPAVPLASERIEGGGAPAWKTLELPVPGDWEGSLGAFEIDATHASPGTRVLLGEPRLTAPGKEPAPVKEPAARSVVLVVLGGVSRPTLAPYGGPRPVPELSQLAAEGWTFTEHRAAGLLASTAMASMLTGTTPQKHEVIDVESGLPRELPTVAEAARQAGIATAMFTANPLTTAAYGFNRDWETFVERSPAEQGRATLVFDDAAEWADKHRNERFLLVVHARGGHPPWDVPSARTPALAPIDYAGVVEPRHIAELVAKSKRFPMKWTDDDRTRGWAFYGAAIDEHDAALGRVMNTLRSIGRDDGTMVIVTGDVGIETIAPMPFGETDAVDEGRLALPLVIRPASKLGRARRSGVPTGSEDIAKTIMQAFDLAPPQSFGGGALLDQRDPRDGFVVTPNVAWVPPKLSARWGAFVLQGVPEREMRLCDGKLDPECVQDARGTSPLAFLALTRFVNATMLEAERANARQHVPVQKASGTDAALSIWGYVAHEGERGKRR